jgi:hypothetical protein
LIKRAADKPLVGFPRKAGETEGTFRDFSNWLNQQFDDQWETTDVRSDIDDYGTVQWNNRNLEGIMVRVTISQKNAIQGKQLNKCFVFGFVDDVEFSMWRDLLIWTVKKANLLLPRGKRDGNLRACRTFRTRGGVSTNQPIFYVVVVPLRPSLSSHPSTGMPRLGQPVELF